MGGPIVRSYGVPNWEEIFGNKKAGGTAGDSKQTSKKKASAAKTNAGKKPKAAKANAGKKK